MNTLKYIASIVCAGVLATGCSMDASIKDLVSPSVSVTTTVQKASDQEFISAASAGYVGSTSGRNYKASTTAGSFSSQMYVDTPTRHYKFYSSVEGSMAADGL